MTLCGLFWHVAQWVSFNQLLTWKVWDGLWLQLSETGTKRTNTLVKAEHKRIVTYHVLLSNESNPQKCYHRKHFSRTWITDGVSRIFIERFPVGIRTSSGVTFVSCCAGDMESDITINFTPWVVAASWARRRGVPDCRNVLSKRLTWNWQATESCTKRTKNESFWYSFVTAMVSQACSPELGEGCGGGGHCQMPATPHNAATEE